MDHFPSANFADAWQATVGYRDRGRQAPPPPAERIKHPLADVGLDAPAAALRPWNHQRQTINNVIEPAAIEGKRPSHY